MATGPRQFSAKRLFVILLVGISLCLCVYYSPALFVSEAKPSPAQHLQTGGTSVVSFLLENRWRNLYRDAKGVEIDYDSTGSTKGINRMIDRQYAIGFTHAAMTEAKRSEARNNGGEVLHIPVVICAVVPIYNVAELKDKPPLNFTGEVLADIYRGKIVKWNDPALASLNKGASLPGTKIEVVHREDSSGTTFIFTDYLQKASAVWQKEIGPASNKVKWPVGVGMRRNHGVADHVYRTEGAIGYVDLLFAGYGKLQYGAVQNKDKTAFIHVQAENMTAALEGLLKEIPDDLTFQLTNKSGKNAYPICGAVWAVCYQKQPASRYDHVVDFLTWVTHEGQSFAKTMSYAPLPKELVQRAEQKIKLITVEE